MEEIAYCCCRPVTLTGVVLGCETGGVVGCETGGVVGCETSADMKVSHDFSCGGTGNGFESVCGGTSEGFVNGNETADDDWKNHGAAWGWEFYKKKGE